MFYVSLHAGPSVRESRLVCAVTDRSLVNAVAKAALKKLKESEDPVLAHLATGNRKALEEVLKNR